MYFGRKSGYMNQPPAVNMMNQPDMTGMMNQPEMTGMMNQQDMMGMMNPEMMSQYEQMGPEGMYAEQTQSGYTCDPCGCTPYYEHMEVHKPLPEVYVVQKGDTVYKIAQRYGLDWRELAGYNHLGNPDLIYPGERLFIPPRY
ncbi:MAG: LysM peptidoglycan-binding domain-containing protein [Dehalobacter sp. 4CP]|uniref:LysM peptidoglycan-binding domain-containing protein n=1 Tax=Dehalobacter restrictus TaxID=55583 RepID=A0A857DIE8_9FIRM|nr:MULTISPECIES: LysM domain-containing protein [Dehalobacter]NBJ14167.1 LysM peptidoglycan-binding domain-containing protein [Dehalobacter sp. 4CP]MCG1026203.1 LysM peptidoglycan-binding domain-containing protein [Dehalobacter sp.]MCM1564554.1 LysM peptidoglycan-binding domain-containing protein [Dehalobacter sp.]MDJ0304594.1 LysM domain-containing protein [Dehalobacter sp.]OCZ53253.1 hypothetical protein A7D23_08305 [Dehalobacter sp. TeCB1]